MKHGLLAVCALASFSATSGTGKSCSPCCTPERMTEPLLVQPDGQMFTRGGDSSACQVGVFERARLHKVLGGKWLYFLGDSSTRGLFLALYYELLGAPGDLAKALGEVAGAVRRDPENLRPRDPHEAFPQGQLRAALARTKAMARTDALFRYGNESTRSECKATFGRWLGRGDKWTLEECDDFGDPCVDQRAAPYSERGGKNDVGDKGGGDAFVAFDMVAAKSNGTSDNGSGSFGQMYERGEVVSVDDAGGKVMVRFEKAGIELSRPGKKARRFVPSYETRSYDRGDLVHDRMADNQKRCKRMRGATHSIASLHLGFLDAGFCDGELVFTKAMPHDYTEGGAIAPLGAQHFPRRAREFSRRMRQGGGKAGGGCVRVTFRMMPRVVTVAEYMDPYVDTKPREQAGFHVIKPRPPARPSDAATAAAGLAAEGLAGTTRGSESGPEKPKTSGAQDYFSEAEDRPDAIYFQAGAWDRLLACSFRKDFTKFYRAAVQGLRRAAPKAVLVLGSLPSGFAYPADPGPEIQRLRSEAAAAGLGKGAALDKVGECLYYQGPSYLWNATPEELALRDLAHPPPPPLLPLLLGAPKAKRHQRVRDLMDLEKARDRSLAQFTSRLPPGPAAPGPGQKANSSPTAGPLGMERAALYLKLGANAWALDRGVVRDALPRELTLASSPHNARAFRRLHPAMLQVWCSAGERGGSCCCYWYCACMLMRWLFFHCSHFCPLWQIRHHLSGQNVWDVQRLVTGLLHTPGFSESPASPPGDSDSRPAAAALPGSSAPGRAATEARGGAGDSVCGCGARMVVENPAICAPAKEVAPHSREWPEGYPAKGRLAHWAEPCRYVAIPSKMH
mmetsp:Transcript_12245/g.28728  ORF Transcript_12245/g.28728 Transcript_12245/m.28728 type:complete len:847 (-) Transcript_12245:446-2986(-)